MEKFRVSFELELSNYTNAKGWENFLQQLHSSWKNVKVIKMKKEKIE